MIRFPKFARMSMAALGAASLALIGCEGVPEAQVLGLDTLSLEPTNLPWVDEARSDDPNHLTLAVRYVTYKNGDGKPVISQDAAKQAIRGTNEIYRPCNLHFRVEDYQEVRAEDRGLKTNPSSHSELNPIRETFDDPSKLVVVGTGDWNSSGGLGADGANAWTMMPGFSPSGAILEAGVAGHAGIVAHELGHYLNLGHVSNASNLMNPVIYTTSTTLSSKQCESVRQAALTAREAALR